jgi:mono/diheme cytochrome c family protein
VRRSVAFRALTLCAVLSACPEGAEPEPRQDADAERDASENDALDAGGDADNDATLDARIEDAALPAERLSETGLYADLSKGELGPGVRAFTPQGLLWSDGADKQRWVYLPPGTRIDSSNIDGWKLPVGTKLWKEFSLGKKRLETRLLEKTGTETWKEVAFQWNPEQSEAFALPEGQKNVAGTEHDIPSDKDCKRCHDGVADTAIGFSAVLLDHKGPGLTLSDLVKESLLSKPPAAALTVPGAPEEQQALLYLHANCGNCHNDRTFISNVTDVDYWLTSDTLTSVETTNSYRTVQRDLRRTGSVEKSSIIRRMGFRGIQGQMPPIASERVDTEGLANVQRWVTTLFIMRDAGVADGGTGDAGAADAAAADAAQGDAGM